jgi:crotonobetainyl-CoA:carnitine CoA-transferase CaiB-like acyl-CoA transferase
MTSPDCQSGPLATCRNARSAPSVGQHTREILAESGFDTDYIDKLLDEKAAGEP